MIQDIKAVFHNEYKKCEPESKDFIMFVSGRNVLLKQDGNQIHYITFEQIAKQEMKLQFLFSIEMEGEERKFFLGNLRQLPEDIQMEYTFENHNVFRTAKPKELAFAGITACQLANWYENTKYCGHCGTPLLHDYKERMMKCPCCQALHYPKISPAVIIGITKQDYILMTKYAGRDYKKYALVAGFTEIGETAEETVKREVMEEVGLHVKNIRYYKSQPWSFSDTLLLGFFCEVDGEDEICMDEQELAVAEWVHRDDIEVVFDDISLTNEMIVKFKKEK